MSTLSHKIEMSHSSKVSAISLAIEMLDANETFEMFDMIGINMTMSVLSLTDKATTFIYSFL